MKSWDECCDLFHTNGSNQLQSNYLGMGLLWMPLDHELNMTPHSGQHDQVVKEKAWEY